MTPPPKHQIVADQIEALINPILDKVWGDYEEGRDSAALETARQAFKAFTGAPAITFKAAPALDWADQLGQQVALAARAAAQAPGADVAAVQAQYRQLIEGFTVKQARATDSFFDGISAAAQRGAHRQP